MSCESGSSPVECGPVNIMEAYTAYIIIAFGILSVATVAHAIIATVLGWADRPAKQHVKPPRPR